MYWAYQPIYLIKVIPFLGGWLADRLLGDPAGWPHPIVWFGKLISFGEKNLTGGTIVSTKEVYLHWFLLPVSIFWFTCYYTGPD